MSRRGWLVGLLLAVLLGDTAVAKELTPYRHGYEQGRQAGRREGRERTGDAGYYEGERDGFAAGAAYGQQALLNDALAQGFALGQTDGASRGQTEGREKGLEQGRQEGVAQGESKARASADEAARANVKERATAAGQARAAQADPPGDGRRDGRRAGLERASREAQEKDFARAREDYRRQRYRSVPQHRSSVRQAPLAVEPAGWPGGPGVGLFGRRGCPAPDWRYLRYGSDNEEYQRGYRTGYSEGVAEGFEDAYERQYRHAYDRAYSLGVTGAQVVNLQEAVNEAYEKAFVEAREEAFERARKSAHLEAYTPAFEAAYSTAYARLYPQFELEHSQAIEQATYETLYRPPYQAAFAEAESSSFAESYPEQAKLAYDQGWKAEARDFAERPVRVLEAWRTPSDVEGVQLLSVKLRNFSNVAVPGSKVRVSLGAETSRLYHALPPDSEVTVTGLLRLRGAQPEQAELFAVMEQDGRRHPLGTVSVGTQPLLQTP